MQKLIKSVLFLFSLSVVAFTNVSNVLLGIAIGLIFIENAIINKNAFNPKRILNSLAPILILSAISLFWTINLDRGFTVFTRQIMFVLVPLSFAFIPKVTAKNYTKIAIQGLFFGCATVMLILLSQLIIKLIGYEDAITLRYVFSSQTTGKRFVSLLKDIDPIYFGMYCLTALSGMWFSIIKVPKPIKIVGSLIIAIGIVFLNTRMIYFLTLVLALLYVLKLKNKWGIISLAAIALMLLMFFMFAKNTYIYKKLITGTTWELSHNVNTSNTTEKIKTDSRLARWTNILKAEQIQPMIGLGLGSEMDTLHDVYDENNMKTSSEKGFNSHNQFVSYYVILGLLGVLVFLLFFILNFISAVNHKNLAALFFFSTVFFLCLIENLFARNAGIVFIALYLSLYNAQFVKH